MPKILSTAAAILTLAFRDLKPVVGSINGALVPGELKKAAVAALGASTVVAGVVAGLQVLAGDTSAIFTSPTIAGLATFVLTQAAVQVGQLGHGATVESVWVPEGARVTLPDGAGEKGEESDPLGLDSHAYTDLENWDFLGVISASGLETEARRFVHPIFGAYRVFQTEVGPSAPVFESPICHLSYLDAGCPQLPGMPGYRSPGRIRCVARAS